MKSKTRNKLFTSSEQTCDSAKQRYTLI